MKDDTPEGKSVVELGERLSGKHQEAIPDAEFIEFTAQTRMSGVNLLDGTRIRKGAYDAIQKYIQELGAQSRRI